MTCDWHFPLAHDLESWGDARAHDGTVSLQQPLIAPLHGGVTALEFLAYINQDTGCENLPTARDTTFGYELVKAHWQTASGAADFATGWWPKALHDGLVVGTQLAAESPSLNLGAIKAGVDGYTRPTGMEIVLRGCAKMGDGRFANNSWMAEIPEPLTKLSWDNAALVSIATAKQLNVENGDMLTLAANGAQILVPAWIVPGHADESVTLHLGWGPQAPGHVQGRQGCRLQRLSAAHAQRAVGDQRAPRSAAATASTSWSAPRSTARWSVARWCARPTRRLTRPIRVGRRRCRRSTRPRHCTARRSRTSPSRCGPSAMKPVARTRRSVARRTSGAWSST